jgi:hypothetical protein
VQLLIDDATPPEKTASVHPQKVRSWRAHRSAPVGSIGVSDLIGAYASGAGDFQWLSFPRFVGGQPNSIRKASTVPSRPSVLAVIPHYRCERWLDKCLTSLIEQTVPLDGIAVIDDASSQPPLEIVQRFPTVTLNCGGCRGCMGCSM